MSLGGYTAIFFDSNAALLIAACVSITSKFDVVLQKISFCNRILLMAFILFFFSLKLTVLVMESGLSENIMRIDHIIDKIR